MAMKLLAANNAYSTLSGSISASDTTISVAPGTASLFPVPVPGTSYFLLTLKIAASPTIYEIVQVTAVTGDDLTIVRGQEGTSAIAWSAGAVAANLFTAGSFDILIQADELSGTSGAGSIGAASGLTTQGEINRSLRQTGTFSAGGTITYAQELYAYNGGLWRWGGSLPKTVAPGSTPSTDGISSTTWIEVGSANLKTSLAGTASGQGAKIVGFNDPVSGPVTVDDALNARPTSAALLSGNGMTLGYRYDTDATLRNVRDRMQENLSILDYYQAADGTDYGIAMNRIFTKYASALSFAIGFPEGTFNITTPAVYSGSANIYIYGKEGTLLNLNGTGTTANIAITSTRRFTMEDLELAITPPTVNGAKIGVYVNVTNQDVSHNIRNVRATVSITDAAKSVIGFDMMNPSLSSFSDVYIRYSGTLALTTGSNNIAWRLRANSKISTDSMFNNCSVVGAEIAYVITPPVGGAGGAYLEGITWVGCTIVEVLQGVYIQGDSSNAYRSPLYRWIGGHINAYQRCFYAYWVSQIAISDAFFYLFYNATYSGAFGLYAIWVEQTVEVRVRGVGNQLSAQASGQGQAVHVAAGCKNTVVDDISCYTNSQALSVVSYAGSSYTRCLNCIVFYSGTAPSASVALNGTSDVNMGTNNVYAQ